MPDGDTLVVLFAEGRTRLKDSDETTGGLARTG